MLDHHQDETIRVMLVEDDDDIRQDLSDFLRDHGYDVLAASNGQEALGLLNKTRLPQVILLDLWMPVMDGIEFRSQQLRHKKLSSIPIIVISAGSDGKKRAALLGADAFIPKPLDLDALVNTIERYH
jgi:CheY-like chemotaxis protein